MVALFSLVRFFQTSPVELVEPQGLMNEVLSSEQVEKFARVLAPRKFIFPEDYGPHPEYRVEWWYFTGNLQDQEQRDYGYELTFFRFALTPDALPASNSSWRSKQVYMAHFAVSDAAHKQFYVFEKLSRAAAGLAGAKSDQFHVWLHNWSAQSIDSTIFPIRIKAESENITLDLVLETKKPIVLQGDKGFSAKTSQPGNASYYYSYTRIDTHGKLLIKDETIPVTGSSWMDREWSTSALAKDQQGWDWFALQLSDNSEVMFYQFRRKDQAPDLNSSGAFISPDGSKSHLSRKDVVISVLDHWQSPHSKAVYPSKWHLSIPRQKIELDIVPIVNDQELNVSFRYWEGAVKITGSKAGREIRGKGYVELTGYRAE
jgi:predicted secreted hydrolase